MRTKIRWGLIVYAAAWGFAALLFGIWALLNLLGGLSSIS